LFAAPAGGPSQDPTEAALALPAWWFLSASPGMQARPPFSPAHHAPVVRLADDCSDTTKSLNPKAMR